jgi:dihydrolipoamide dehydrogenase
MTNLVVLGGGPGGYTAAFLAADMGMNVTLVDPEINPGGVCLFRGCIPSKALLHVAKLINEAREAHKWGVTFKEPQIDLDKLRDFKERVVTQLTGGTGQLLKQRKIKHIQGYGKFKNSTTLEVEKVDGKKETVEYDYAIIATGSHPIIIPGLIPDSKRIMDSTDALNLESIPKSMLIMGGGVIGMEMGTVYSTLGSEVSVVEMLPGLLPGADRDLVRIFQKSVEKNYKKIMTSTKVVAMEEVKNGIKVSFETSSAEKFDETYEKVLVTIGRSPNSKNLGLENTKVVVGEKGFIQADRQLKTADPAIFAIGDVIGNPMLAHKASHEGQVAVEVIAGHKAVFEPNSIPAVVYTDPELAWAGITEDEAKEKGHNVDILRFPWAASGRALSMDRTDGLTKLIIDKDTERILGMGIVGVGAGELIAEGVLAIEMATLASDLKMTIHPHPTISETIMESAEMFFGTATSVYRPKKK